ncbi:hypothetical protein SAMN04488120_1127 [Fontimonas thermophila]|uniref:Uncharacterized protein n=1 Tax=Fontimonas thermophila TaxID=1076937 RepID=A0A1I2K1J0_9GAMM|nr:hypothetical protein [Fontimonas thermophila]SFF60724.1 hypothetical protein SAMN04488120_1127 [Fontimonas thermophila]
MTSRHWEAHELESVTRCPYCQSGQRRIAYAAIPDRIGTTQGTWTYWECRDCRSLYVSPRPTPTTIGRAYAQYYTHDQCDERPRQGVLDRWALSVRQSYLARKFGFAKPKGSRWRWVLTNRDGIFHRCFGADWFDLCAPQHLSLPSGPALRACLENLGFAVRRRQRGAHAQSHWRACQAVRRADTRENIYIASFTGRKTAWGTFWLDGLLWLIPGWQGDLVLQCRKNMCKT